MPKLMLFLLSLIPFGSSLSRIVASLFESFSPLLADGVRLLARFFGVLWEGLKDVVDDIRTVVFVLVLILGTSFYTQYTEEKECRAEIVEVRKKMVRKPTQAPSFEWPWESLFK